MNRMERTICIDFGTSNSSVVYVKNGEIRQIESWVQASYLFPSYVMYQNGRVIVGEAAISRVVILSVFHLQLP